MTLPKKVLISVWTGFWFLMGIAFIYNTPEQIRKDKAFIEEQIKPAVNWTNQFKKDSSRLPSKGEFYHWGRIFYHDYADPSLQPDSLLPWVGIISYIRSEHDMASEELPKFKDADFTKDFAIGAWRGEWMEYYYSWNSTYETNNFTWRYGIESLFYYWALATVPFILVFWYRKIRKTIHDKRLAYKIAKGFAG